MVIAESLRELLECEKLVCVQSMRVSGTQQHPYGTREHWGVKQCLTLMTWLQLHLVVRVTNLETRGYMFVIFYLIHESDQSHGLTNLTSCSFPELKVSQLRTFHRKWKTINYLMTYCKMPVIPCAT